MKRCTIFKLFTVLACVGATHSMTVSGRVKDEYGNILSGAQVKLGIADVTTISGNDGTFSLNSSTAIQQKNRQVSPEMDMPIFLNGKLSFTSQAETKILVRKFDTRGRQLAVYVHNCTKGKNTLTFPQSAKGVQVYCVDLNGNRYTFRNAGSVQSINKASQYGNARNKYAENPENVNEDYLLVTKNGYLLHRQKVTGTSVVNLQISLVSLQTGKMQDGEGNEYKTIKIGNQEWTSENIRTTKFNDGSSIPLVKDSSQWVNLNSPGYCFYNNSSNIDDQKKWGALYNWHTVATGKLAPAGWHVPSDAEWDTLQNYMITHGYNFTGAISEENLIAIALSSQTDWETFTVVGAPGRDPKSNNGSGFTAIPAGHRNAEGLFDGMGRNCHWSCTTEADLDNAWDHEVYYFFWYLGRLPMSKNFGSSVRLIRDK